MSLRNSLYYIVESSEPASVEEPRAFTIRFDASHPVFAGHFPGHPIVPGACLVQIAQELQSELSGQPIRFTSVRNLKFRQPVTPDRIVCYTLADGKITITNTDLTETYAQFNASYMCPDSDVQ